MQYYKLVASLAGEEVAATRKRNSAERIAISAKSNAFNKLFHDRVFFCVADIIDNILTAGIICAEDVDINQQFQKYANALDMKLNESLQTEEITFHALRNLLSQSEHNDYIEDAEDVFEQFGLGKLGARYCRDLSFRENLINEADKTDIYNRAVRLLTMKQLLPELDRIYVGRTSSEIAGHPVHYMLQTDDMDICGKTVRLLLQALYANGRLQNRRYSTVAFETADEISRQTYDQLYKSNSGGAVIVLYRAGCADADDLADGSRDTIDLLCKAMKKYRNQVLTVFCLPRECNRTKEIFFENLGTTSFIELQEEFAEGECAKNYLKMLARENHIRTDKKLFDQLEEGKGYLAPDLQSIFDEWYNSKLKTVIYPQYKETATVKREIAKAKPKGSAYDELMEMIGLTEAKKVIVQALNYHKAQKLFADKGMKTDYSSMHMVFTGNPGTAKTTVARLLARIMRENGLLSKGQLVEVGRGDLVGRYVGWTAQTVQKKFKQAEGGVLFIDEAYSLVDDRDGSFGDEAINTIVQEMENHRDSTIVILAGYPDKMEEFLQKNPGLRSRIAYHVPFADYTVEELCKIAELIAKKKGLYFDNQAREKLTAVFETARRQADFGNGRYVRNMIEKAKIAQATRLIAADYESVTQKDIITLCAEDIETPKFSAQVKPKIGFSV